MGLISKLFKGNAVDNTVSSICDGDMISLNQVKDKVFSSGMMGEGVAFVLKNNVVYAPCDGQIEVLFPTKHAVAIRRNDGTGILIHIGIDTVELNGQGFESFIKQGDKVKKGQKLIEVDLDFLKEKNVDSTTMLVISEKGNDTITFEAPKSVSKSDVIANIA